MASAAANDNTQQLACRCLNVRLRTAPTEAAPPEPSSDPDFSKIHVGDDGIQVAHPQLTLRVKSRSEPVPGTSRCARFATLNCLVCDLAVYRVHQVFSAEVEAKDLPLLPSDDWAEQEIMKSPTGWIEVSKDCLQSGEAITQAASSDEYSNIYSLVLPSAQETAPTSPGTWISPESTASSTPTPTIPDSYMRKLPPLLPPPPFTPSHPAFSHLVSVAEKKSQAIRTAADEELAQIVRDRVAEVEAKEAELKAQIERLWLKFRHGLDKVQQEERPHAPSSSVPWSSPARANDHRSNGPKAPVAIPGFIPVSVTAPTTHTAPPPPRKSWLSQSLATNSTLDQAMGDRKTANASHTSDGTSSHSESPTLVPNSVNEREITSILHVRRRIDDTINTAASYRYFLLEEQMTQRNKAREGEADSDHDDGAQQIAASTQDKAKQSDKGATSLKGESKSKEKDPKDTKASKSKSKHVHFNIQPPTKGSSSKKDSNKPDPGEMVFQIDDEVAGEARSEEVQASLPLLESTAPLRARKPKPQNTVGLPASFSALRPASLPAPSPMRSANAQNRNNYSNNIMSSLPRAPNLDSKGTNGTSGEREDTTDQDTSEDTTDSSPRPTSDSESEPEDDAEEYHHHTRYGIPGSLPINIVSAIRTREVLSLASYQPKTTIERQPTTVATAPAPTNGTSRLKKPSSSAIRKAAYKERDRARLLDPGNLDFVAEVDEEDEQADKKPIVQSADGERSRTHAFQILKARAELPEEGMWRSLAS